ncbi:MAG: branched-chain amino acid ABC transporter permease [Acidimicrobiia bacterium]
MIQALINGLLLGANYALLGLGYTLVFGVMHLLTLSHGEVFMAAGLVALLLAGTGTPIWLAGLYALVIGALLSALTDLVSFRPVGYRRPIAAAVSTIGFALVVQNTLLQVRGSSTAVAVPFSLPRADMELGGILISVTQVVSLAVAGMVLAVTHQFVRRTRWGMAMRAFAHDPEVVPLLGVPVRRLTVLTLLIAGALAGVASYLLAVRNGSVSPFAGLELGLKGLAIMTIGGLGSLPGAMVAGIGLGLIESLAAYFGLTGFQAAVPWLLLIVVLLVRPQGLALGKAA